ncbi:MAG: sulfatase-like hydrolase/transferase [Phycisphaerae bacterium]
MTQPRKHNTPGVKLSRRRLLQAGAGGAAALSVRGILPGASPQGRGKAGPNVLLVMTDQQHIATVASRGCRHVKTPGLDRLCRDGVTFLQSHSTNPLCSPARSSLWTGRMPSEAGVPVNGRPIHKSIPNIGQWFGEHTGYETIYVGKWHLPGSFTHNVPGFTVLTPGVGGQGNLGDTSTSLACEGYLRNRSKDKPFLMVASFFQPHDICQWLRINQHDPGELRYPQLADELPALPANFRFDPNEPAALGKQRDGNEPGVKKGKWSELHWRYYIWSYYRHIEMVDAEIGRLLDALRQTGHAENTLVMFTSDHGEGLGHHQMVRKNFLYEESVKVPMIVSFGGQARADVVDAEHMVCGLDVVPTVCDYVGIKPPPNMHGRSLRPLLEGRASNRLTFVASEIGHRARMIRSERYKYVKYRDDPVEQLFDMKADPVETKNLAGDSKLAGVVTDHRRMLAEWQERLSAPPDLPKEQAWPQG